MNPINRYMLLPLLLLSGSGSYATATSPASEKEQTEPKKLENQRGYLQLKFKDLSWSLHLLRRMGYAPSGGADIGECLEIAEHIHEGDFQSWQTEWAKAANRLLSYSSKAMSNNHTETAKEGLETVSLDLIQSALYIPEHG